MFPLQSSLSIPANVGCVFLMLYKRGEGIGEAGEENLQHGDDGRPKG